MSLALPNPQPDYSQQYMNQLLDVIRLNDTQTVKKNQDFYLTSRLIMTSPSGDRFFIKVDDNGELITELIPRGTP